MVSGKWYIGTDNMVHLQNLKNEAGTFINDATSVTGKFKDAKNAQIGPDITFAPNGGSDGGYDGVVPANDTLKVDVEYDLFIICLAAGRKFTGRIPLKAAHFDL